MTQPAQNLPAERKPQLVAGGEVAAIVPRTLEETFRLANALAGSGLAPASLKTPDQVMVAIMAGAELGLPPFQSLQSFAVINGRPAIWGDGLMAVVRSHGFKVREWLDGEGDAMVARCEVTRPDTGEVVPGEFSVVDAKKAGLWGKTGPWQSYPKRMLKMRARAFALRDGAADVLRGFQVREEVEDYVREVQPAGRPATGMRARLEAREVSVADQQGFSADHVAATVGASTPADAEFTDEETPQPSDREVTPGGEASPEAGPQAEASSGQDRTGTLAGREGASAEGTGAGQSGSAPPAAEGHLPPGVQRGSDLPAPAYIYEDAAEFASVAAGHLEAVNTRADLDALWEQWKAELVRLRKADLPEYQRICGLKNARKSELEKAEARV